MVNLSASRSTRTPSRAFLLTIFWVITLMFSGGASRIDVLGQTVVHLVAWLILLICTLFLEQPNWRRYSALIWFFACVVGVIAMQLVPLPPAIWHALPGRGEFAGLTDILGREDVWRPVSISPGLTFGSLGSLVVVVTTFCLIVSLRRDEYARLMSLLLAIAVASGFVGVMQFAGSGFDNPLVNDTPREVSGLFANRNHFALLLAIACTIVPVWAFSKERRASWRVGAALGLLAFFLPLILATGSRAGVVLAVAGLILGSATVKRQGLDRFRELGRLGRVVTIGTATCVIGGVLLASVLLGRAASVDRAVDLGVGGGIRGEAMVTITSMISAYFPVGTGFGTFDPAYRIAEPSQTLRPKYLNQAHNEFLQIILEGGLPGLIFVIVALVWFWRMSWILWTNDGGRLGRLGSSVLLLIMLASIIDYPARTPLIMALATIAAIWINDAQRWRARTMK